MLGPVYCLPANVGLIIQGILSESLCGGARAELSSSSRDIGLIAEPGWFSNSSIISM